MVETFYKVEVTQERLAQLADYHTLSLINLTASFFIVSDHHGWWDNVANKARLKTTILTTADEPTPEVEARRIYDEQRTYLISQGFIHVYQRDILKDVPPQEAPAAIKGNSEPQKAEV